MHSIDRTSLIAALAIALLAAACHVDDKHNGAPDGGPGDAGTGPGDNTAPDTTIDLAPDPFSASAQSTFKFSSNDPHATFECRVDQQAAAPCQSPDVFTLSDGPHTFSVRAISAGGTGDATPAERAWTIDTVAPDTTLLSGPPLADNSVTVTFTFSSNEDDVAFDCSLDNAAFQPCTSGSAIGGLGDGPHSFAVRARDRAGNVDLSPAVYAWTIDTRTPDTQILSGPTGPSPSTTATFTFFSPDAGAGATFQCSLDGGGFTACTSPQTYNGLAEAAHDFKVRVRDAVGNVDPTPADHTWTVDLTPPDTAITGGPTGTVPVASANFTFTSSEANSTFECALDAGGFAACTSPAALTGLAQGPHTFSVRATDAAGHTDASPATRSWTVDTAPPDVVITAGPASGATSGPRVSFSFTVSDGTVVCSLDGAGFAACASPFAVNLPAGPHQFAIRATDGVGNATTMTRSWTVACSPPDATGAAGLLHLDDTGQTLTNAVAGGASATLGDSIAVEPSDPTPLAAARFGGGLTFTSAEGDHVAWPTALPAAPALTIELWARPTAPTGTRDVFTNSDASAAIRVAAASATTVQFSFTVVDPGPGGAAHTATSAAVPAGAWHHVLASLATPAVHLWVDGVRSDATGVAATAAPPLDAVRIGGGAATAYDGDLDEIWLAETAITTDDAALARYCPL